MMAWADPILDVQPAHLSRDAFVDFGDGEDLCEVLAERLDFRAAHERVLGAGVEQDSTGHGVAFAVIGV
jgi:hypothetical protein